ncbi:hypothetical protein [Dyella sp. 2RAB6]|uniref:hypothetical protein n=1 Tax=Dyella sp. 2RAB6 TaxID=3232992 RepID=UPI003F91BDEA
MDRPVTLTFKTLNECIDDIPEHPGVAVGLSTREKYGYAISLLAVALFFLSMKVLPDKLYTLVIACFLLLVELVAVAATLIPKWPPRFPSFRSERTEYAEQLDYDFAHYGGLISWITGFPRDQIADMADYAESGLAVLALPDQHRHEASWEVSGDRTQARTGRQRQAGRGRHGCG